MTAKSTRKASAVKVQKPHPELWLHPSGRWCRKIRGRAHYFGKVDDLPNEVVDRYLAVRDDLLAGRTPRPIREGCTVRDLANRFLTHKRQLLDAGEIVQRTFLDYHRSCGLLVDAFGASRLVDDLAPEDFERLRAHLSKTQGAVTLGNEITRCRVVFKYAYDSALLDRPVRYGQAFRKPAKRVIRKERSGRGPRLLTAAQIRQLLKVAPMQLRGMILLACNTGMGNSDVGRLPIGAVDLQAGWLDFARPKTGVARRAPLWPETVAALQEVFVRRPAPKAPGAAELLFLTRCGLSWAKPGKANPISREFRKLLEKVGLYRKGLGFYTLRHVFQTVADEARDFPATSSIMGHEDTRDIATHYREGVSDARLRAVVEHVCGWLFGSEETK